VQFELSVSGAAVTASHEGVVKAGSIHGGVAVAVAVPLPLQLQRDGPCQTP
jgi:hypothetical protein